jgi:hypothetical protein
MPQFSPHRSRSPAGSRIQAEVNILNPGSAPLTRSIARYRIEATSPRIQHVAAHYEAHHYIMCALYRANIQEGQANACGAEKTVTRSNRDRLWPSKSSAELDPSLVSYIAVGEHLDT